MIFSTDEELFAHIDKGLNGEIPPTPEQRKQIFTPVCNNLKNHLTDVRKHCTATPIGVREKDIAFVTALQQAMVGLIAVHKPDMLSLEMGVRIMALDLASATIDIPRTAMVVSAYANAANEINTYMQGRAFIEHMTMVATEGATKQ